MEVMDLRKGTDIMPFSFLYFRLTGAWKPLNLPKYLGVIYDLYTISMVFFVIKLAIVAEILCVVFAKENQPQLFKDNVYIICTMINGWSKIFNIINRRKNIMTLMNCCIAKQWNPPRNRNEAMIFTAIKDSSRRTSLLYASTVGSCVTATVLNALLSPSHFLPLDAWYPCNISLPVCYWSSFVHQSIAYVVDAFVHVANDNLIVGFMMQICAQFNILILRLLSIHVKIEEAARQKKDPRVITSLETSLINECINDYKDILKFAKLLSETFIEVIFVQFCTGLSVIGTTIYLLTKLNIFSLEFLGMFLYLCCMLSQMFLYCWYGNEVNLNSSKLFHSIYSMNWITFQKQTRTKLLFMMLVALSPIQLFRGAIIRVNLDAFINILKFSYSAFNILH